MGIAEFQQQKYNSVGLDVFDYTDKVFAPVGEARMFGWANATV